MKVRDSILKKRRISLTPVPMIKSYETQRNIGGFVKPKTYQIN